MQAPLGPELQESFQLFGFQLSFLCVQNEKEKALPSCHPSSELVFQLFQAGA